jgi:lipopolysaccharide transport system ATP-binding protein
MSKMESVTKEGRTILFVSHNMGAISELCTSAALLHKGALIKTGAVADVLAEYNRYSRVNSDALVQIPINLQKSSSIVSVAILDSDGNKRNAFDLADEVTVEIIYEVRKVEPGLQLTVTLTQKIIDLTHSFDTDRDLEIPLRRVGKYRAIYVLPGMLLKGGDYYVSIAMGTPELLIQNLHHVLNFEVEELSINTQSKGYRKDRPGLIISPGSWVTKKIDEDAE